MKTFTFLMFFSFVFFSINLTAQVVDDSRGNDKLVPQFNVIPPEYATTPGTAIFTGPLGTTQRTYQLLIHENLLTSLVGKEIASLGFRMPTAATANWPAADVLITNYDIYLSGSVAPANRSLTFIENIVGPQTQVRQGSLTIPANSYRFGSTPNDFGPPITFDTLYLYNGGHLLIEIRHNGFSGTSRSNDAIGTSTAGYGTLFSGCWTGSYTGVTGLQGNFSVILLTSDDPIPVELTSFIASVNNNNVVLNWTTATELNNKGFEIERKSGDSDFKTISFMNGYGTTSEPQTYTYTDSKLSQGVYTYRLKQIDFDGTFEYSKEVSADVTTPLSYSLDQNYPNPFNPTTTISFTVTDPGMVKITLINILGEELNTLLNEFKEAGAHSVTLDASNLSSGVYFYKLESAQFTQIKKMLLTK